VRVTRALAKPTGGGIEYAVGVIPLGGFVTIPGMHRPIPHDAERRFARAVEEVPALGGPVDRVKRALGSDDLDDATQAVAEFAEALRTQRLAPRAVAAADAGDARHPAPVRPA